MSTAFSEDSELQSLIVSPRETFGLRGKVVHTFKNQAKDFFLSSWQQEQPNFWFQFPEREEKESRS